MDKKQEQTKIPSYRDNQKRVLEEQGVSVCINHTDHRDSAHTGAKCGFCIACEDAGNGNPCPCGCEEQWVLNQDLVIGRTVWAFKLGMPKRFYGFPCADCGASATYLVMECDDRNKPRNDLVWPYCGLCHVGG